MSTSFATDRKWLTRRTILAALTVALVAVVVVVGWRLFRAATTNTIVAYPIFNPEDIYFNED